MGHLQKTVHIQTQQEGTTSTTQNLDVAMLNAAVMLYHLGVSSRFKTTTQQQNTVRQALAQLNEAKARMRSNEASASRLDSTAASLLNSVVDGLRLMTYSRAILTGDKQPLAASSSDPPPSIERYRPSCSYHFCSCAHYIIDNE
jgi:hypothetical protein